MAIYGFNEDDVDRLRVMLGDFEGKGTGRGSGGLGTGPVPSQRVVGRLTGSIAATTSLTADPTTGTLTVYKFDTSGTITATTTTVGVYNFSVTSCTTDRWYMASKESMSAGWLLDFMGCS